MRTFTATPTTMPNAIVTRYDTENWSGSPLPPIRSTNSAAMTIHSRPGPSTRAPPSSTPIATMAARATAAGTPAASSPTATSPKPMPIARPSTVCTLERAESARVGYMLTTTPSGA